MEIDSTNQENVGATSKGWNKLKDFSRKIKKKVGKIAKNTKQIGKDDPRKIWHAFKVALALFLVSLFYYTDLLYRNFDQQAMWATLTVVVVFEFTAGATISKSINRGFGTALAGALGLGVKHLAELIGKKGPNPIVLGVLVFIVDKMRRDTCSIEAMGAMEKPPPSQDDVDGSDFVMIEIGDNTESTGRVVLEEVNNPISAIKRESFVIWIRGSTKTTIVEEIKMPGKVANFMNLADIKLYNSVHEFFKSLKGLNQVKINNN